MPTLTEEVTRGIRSDPWRRLGANCWDELIPHLNAAALAVDLPGRGTRAEADLGTVTLADCADAVREDVEAKDLRDVVLVGHSFAGVTVPRVLDLLADRIRHVVLVSAVVPPDGSRVLDQIDPEVRDLVERSIAGGVYRQTREGAAAMLCNDMDEVTAASTLDRLADDSAALLSETVDLSGYGREIPGPTYTSPGTSATSRNSSSDPSRCWGPMSSISTPAIWR